MLSHAIVLASSMFDVSSRAKLSVSALAERKIASARPRKYGLLLRAEEEMLLYGQALVSSPAKPPLAIRSPADKREATCPQTGESAHSMARCWRPISSRPGPSSPSGS